MDGDPEALAFASQLSHILAAAKWKVAPGAWKPANTLVIGVALPPLPTANPDGQTLRDAFAAAGIGFATDALPASGASFNVATAPGAPILMVGSRLPVLP